jgi:predicted nucleic acid-binding protein
MQRSRADFDKLVGILKKRITSVPNEETEKFLSEARKISPDKGDADYFALALKLGCPIWSNDKMLKKQDTIVVYSTEELAGMF